MRELMAAFGLSSVGAPVPQRAELLARFRVGQLVEIVDDICDRYAEDRDHQLRIAGGTRVLITALAGHSGEDTRYRFVLVENNRPTLWWNTALGSNLTEAAQPETLKDRVIARLRGWRW